MTREKTEQEIFWEGNFGTEYTGRVRITPELRQPFFAEILKTVQGVKTVCELGANRGHNLQAIRNLASTLHLTGVELNKAAISELEKTSGIEVVCSSIQDFNPVTQFDLVFTCGVLIHINPDDLPLVYQKINHISSRYVLINEYYNPQPVEVNYRGHGGKLFKRDFAGEFIEQNGGHFLVVDYGFLWKRLHPAWDDTTWFLLEKTS
jgi:spore coat polysaccharide biosynthesis protein SpsF